MSEAAVAASADATAVSRLAGLQASSALAAARLALELARGREGELPGRGRDSSVVEQSAVSGVSQRTSSVVEQSAPTVSDLRQRTEKDQERNLLERSLYVGQLGQQVTESCLKQHFQQFGVLTDLAVLDGYGFITFQEPQMMEACLQSGPHYVKGKMVRLERRGGSPRLLLTTLGNCSSAGWTQL